jgi:molecular chaperone GrpE (heat shock protein)
MSTTASKEQQLSRERQELASQQAEVAALREENQKKHSQEKQKNIEALHKCLESFDSFETLSLSEFFLGVGEMLTWPANHPGLAIGA